MWNRPDYCLTEGIKAVQRQTSAPASLTGHDHLGRILFILHAFDIFTGREEKKKKMSCPQ